MWDTSMPNGQPRRSLDASRGGRAVRLPSADAAARRPRAHGRLVSRAGACTCVPLTCRGCSSGVAACCAAAVVALLADRARVGMRADSVDVGARELAQRHPARPAVAAARVPDRRADRRGGARRVDAARLRRAALARAPLHARGLRRHAARRGAAARGRPDPGRGLPRGRRPARGRARAAARAPSRRAPRRRGRSRGAGRPSGSHGCRLPDPSVDAFKANMAGVREYFWSHRVLQWLPIAGVIAVARRSAARGLALAAGSAAYVALPPAGQRGRARRRRALPRAPSRLPAYVLLVASLPLLVPTLAARLGPCAPVEPRLGQRSCSSSRCSSRASRCARMTFWSASFEITVE